MSARITPGTLAGVERIALRPTPVALIEPIAPLASALGIGPVSHPLVGDRIAIAVSCGKYDAEYPIYAALLAPDAVDAFVARLLRAAAEARSEGRA